MSKKIIYQGEGEVTQVSPDFVIKDKMSPNFYKIVSVQMGMFSKKEVRLDYSISLPNNALGSYKDTFDVGHIERYFSPESRSIHTSLKVKHKMGVLLHGKQGTGKTTLCYSLASYLIKQQDALVFTVDCLGDLMFALDFTREADPSEGTLKIFIMDECESDMYHNESTFKRVLDSATSSNNCLFLFTTNYFDEIPETIKDRPSRIKYVMEIVGYGNEEDIYNVMKELNDDLDDHVKLEVVDIKKVVPKMKGKTIDEIKNTFVDLVLKTNLKKKGIKPTRKKAVVTK